MPHRETTRAMAALAENDKRDVCNHRCSVADAVELQPPPENRPEGKQCLKRLFSEREEQGIGWKILSE